MKPRILSLVPRGRTGSYLWRSVWPSHALQDQGYIADYVWFDEYQKEVLPRMLSGHYNVVITPRCCFFEDYMLIAWQHMLDKAGLAWVYETDDDMFSPPIEDRFFWYAEARRISPDMDPEERSLRLHEIAKRERRVRTEMLGIADVAIVSTEALGKVARQHTQAPVYVVPNAINIPWYVERMSLDETRLVPQEQLIIGWGGGWRPGDDTLILGEVWSRLAKRYPHVKFVLIGWSPEEITCNLPKDRLIEFKWQDLDSYPFYLRNIDIACCIVADNVFNVSKTPIKFYESVLAGSAVVGSHVLYGDVITDGHDGLLATTAYEWESQLARLIEDAELRRTLQANAVQTVKEHHTMERNWKPWLAACEDALTRSERLVAA